MKTSTMLSALLTSLVLMSAPFAHAKVPADKVAEVEKRKKERGGEVLGARIGKKVGKAFELYSEEKITEALALLLELEPKSDFDKAYVERFIGNMYATLQKPNEALEYLVRAEKLDRLPFRDHSDVLKLIADLNLQEKNYDSAIEYYQKFLDFTLDNNADVYFRMSNSYYELGKYNKAIEHARKAIQFAEEPKENYYVLVMASYYEMKDNVNATKATEDLVRNFPENKRWWPQLGSFYSLTEDYEKGLATMSIAYKNGFLEKENHFKQTAQLYATQGVPFKAAQIQEKHMKAGDIERNERNLSALASTYRNAKEFDKAAKYYGEAGDVSKDPDYYRRQGDMLLVAEDFKAAIKAYEKALDGGIKKKGTVYLSIADANYQLRDFKEAYVAINEAVKDKNTAKSAKAWVGYIKDAAERNGVKL